jgi:hypothetical protein
MLIRSAVNRGGIKSKRPVRYPKSNQELPVPVHILSQAPRALESHYPSAIEHHVPTRRGISSPSLSLVFKAEFPEAAYENIFSRLKGCLDDLEKRFGQLERLRFAQATVFVNVSDDVGFSQSHFQFLPGLAPSLIFFDEGTGTFFVWVARAITALTLLSKKTGFKFHPAI